MKQYPSIPRATGQTFFEFKAHVFDKLDGRNFRVEYNKKQGWFKFGSRTQLVDNSDPLYKQAIYLFNKEVSEPLTKLFVDNRWDRGLAFFEWW